ncbi:transposase family protein (plasmid) [Enterococcus faecium]
MLNLPSFKILDMKESEYDYRFLVETILPPPSYCPKCGTVANLYKHGKKEQLFFDLPMHAKRVGSLLRDNVTNVMSVGLHSLKVFQI